MFLCLKKKPDKKKLPLINFQKCSKKIHIYVYTFQYGHKKDKQPGMTPVTKIKSVFYLICNTNRDYRKEQDYARLCLDDIIVNNLAGDPFQEMGLDFRKLTEK